MARSYTQHPKRANRAEKAAGIYYVECCATCRHPGGLHVAWPPEKQGCRCCDDCKVYVPGDYERWSAAMTAAVPDRKKGRRS